MSLLSILTSFHLRENKLYGKIPPSLQNCHSLLIFNILENILSGNIPNWIPHGVKVLQLRSNSFSGNIPVEMCQMSSLIILDIADNTISGYIPNCLCNITALVFNNASYNTLSFSFLLFGYRLTNDDSLELVTKGRESEYGRSLHFLTLIDMSSNNLSGTVPLQLFSLTGLISLNLSHNKLTGKIPNEIDNMKKLESLDFSRNQLSGEIPESLSSLSFLSYLNLSYNNLTGKIPLGTQLQGAFFILQEKIIINPREEKDVYVIVMTITINACINELNIQGNPREEIESYGDGQSRFLGKDSRFLHRGILKLTVGVDTRGSKNLRKISTVA
ncbi:hypothetical protein Fmac_018781 [Flemingia macrophylla]|uniref:Uncharacterized protein n=1 Tax=Flemingia macrophylla TaxID=520843 RepID=A0ABD1M5X4_9FABA